MKPRPQQPRPGQESVWDYPRPPRLEPTERRIQVIVGDVTVADTTGALRLLETSHPPTYYIPPADIATDHIVRAAGASFCEWKGAARYVSVRSGGRLIEQAGWYYPDPAPDFAALRDHIAFYAAKMDRCLVAGEEARPQPGGFYGGWVTDDVVGPFKGEPGTGWW